VDNPSGYDDLLRSARRGDEAAFRTVYRTLQPDLLRYLTTLVGAEAEDVSAEAWLQIVRDFERFRGGWSDFRGRAVTIARHRALDHLRRQQRRPAAPLPVTEFVGFADAADTAEDAVDRITTYRAIELIATLPADQAEAIILRVLFGFDAAATGQIMRKRPGAVRTAAHRVLRTLRQRLGGGPEPATMPARGHLHRHPRHEWSRRGRHGRNAARPAQPVRGRRAFEPPLGREPIRLPNTRLYASRSGPGRAVPQLARAGPRAPAQRPRPARIPRPRRPCGQPGRRPGGAILRAIRAARPATQRTVRVARHAAVRAGAAAADRLAATRIERRLVPAAAPAQPGRPPAAHRAIG